MSHQKQKKPVFNFLIALGNANILWHHILAIEEDIKEKGEDRKEDITNTPHFAAWIRMLSEYISNSLYDSYYQMHLLEECYDYSFKDIIKAVKKEHVQNPSYLKNKKLVLNEVIDTVKIFIELRHCFQHGGLPNIARSVTDTNRKKINEMLNPKNFKITKALFLKAASFTLHLPKQSVGL